MTPAGGEAQQIAGTWILGGEDRRFSERLKCQNSIQFEKLWNVFHKWRIGKGGGQAACPEPFVVLRVNSAKEQADGWTERTGSGR